MAKKNLALSYYLTNLALAITFAIFVVVFGINWHFILLLIIPVIVSFVVLDNRAYLIPLFIYLFTDVILANYANGINYNSLMGIVLRISVLLISGEVIYYFKKKTSKAIGDLEKSKAEMESYIKELQKSRDKFHTLLNYTYDWEYFINTEGEIEYSSPSCIYQTQYSDKEFINEPELLLKIVHPDDREMVEEHYRQEMNNERPKPIEFRIIKKNGDLRVLRHTCNPVLDNDKRFIGVRVTNRNSTDRWLAEKQVRESERKYRYIFNNLLDVYYRTSIDGTIEVISPSVEKISGYKMEELVGKNATLFYQDKEAREKFIEQILEHGQLRNYELQFVDKDGSVRTLSFNNRLIYDDNNKPVAIEGIFRDVTEDHQIRKELEEERNKFKTLFDTNLAGVYISTTHGTILECNEATARMFGYDSPEELKKRKAIDFYVDAGDRIQLINKLKREKTITSNEYLMKKKDGSTIWVLENCRILDGNKMMGTMIDITELKEAFDKLQESEKYLLESNATKDRFFSIIAHDIRSPFTSLLGLTTMILEDWDTAPNEELKEMMEHLKSSLNKLYKLIEALLEWARIQTNRIEFEPNDFVLKDLVESLVYLYKLKCNDKKIRIDTEIDPDIKVYTDENMFSTVVRNLVSNALKFTPVGGSVVLRAKKGESFTKISVSDSGIGMDPEIIKKLFKIGERVSMKGTDGETGTGLGLILCDELVKKMGGKIWVESKRDQGTTFYFTIPNAQ